MSPSNGHFDRTLIDSVRKRACRRPYMEQRTLRRRERTKVDALKKSCHVCSRKTVRDFRCPKTNRSQTMARPPILAARLNSRQLNSVCSTYGRTYIGIPVDVDHGWPPRKHNCRSHENCRLFFLGASSTYLISILDGVLGRSSSAHCGSGPLAFVRPCRLAPRRVGAISGVISRLVRRCISFFRFFYIPPMLFFFAICATLLIVAVRLLRQETDSCRWQCGETMNFCMHYAAHFLRENSS